MGFPFTFYLNQIQWYIGMAQNLKTLGTADFLVRA